MIREAGVGTWSVERFLTRNLLHNPHTARWALYGALQSYIVSRTTNLSTYTSWLGRLFGYRRDKKLDAARVLQAVVLEEQLPATLADHKAVLTQGRLGEIYLSWQEVTGRRQDEPPFFPEINHAWRHAINTWLYKFIDTARVLKELNEFFVTSPNGFLGVCIAVSWNIMLGLLMSLIGVFVGLYGLFEGIIKFTFYSIKTAMTYLFTILFNLFMPQNLYTRPYKIASVLMWPVSFLFDRILNIVESITSPIQTIVRPFYECCLHYRPRTIVLMSVLGLLLATFCILSIVFSMGTTLPAALIFLQPLVQVLSPALLWMAQGITVLGVQIGMSIFAALASFAVVIHTFFYPQVKKAQIEEVLSRPDYTTAASNAYSEWLNGPRTFIEIEIAPQRTSFFHRYRSCLHDVVPTPEPAVEMDPIGQEVRAP